MPLQGAQTASYCFFRNNSNILAHSRGDALGNFLRIEDPFEGNAEGMLRGIDCSIRGILTMYRVHYNNTNHTHQTLGYSEKFNHTPNYHD